MSGDQRDPWQLIEERVGQETRRGWRERWRKNDPPRVRMRVRTPDGKPLGTIVQETRFAGGWACIDVLVDDTGKAVSIPVPCDSE